jgi:anti-sigma regulatory factor (Ser/Thr protein kinase)
MSEKNVHLKFLVPSHPRFLSVVRAAVGELGAVYGLSEKECAGMTLAVDEAMANIIRHAYGGGFDGEIEVNCQVGDGRLEFTLLDQGECPDPERLAAHPLDDVALSGRGTHIMRTVMDEVCYERVPGGNQVRLTKRLPAGTDAEYEGNN